MDELTPLEVEKLKAFDDAVAKTERSRLASHDAFLAELAKLLMPHIKEAILADLEASITSVIDEYNFDQIIETRCDELDLVNEDAVRELIDDHSNDDYGSYSFRTAVKDAVRDMDIKLQID